MDIHDWNRERFRQLMVEKFDGKQTLIASAIEMPASYVSRILSGKKRLGVDVITKIEEKAEMPGWFDSGPSQTWDSMTIRFANWFNSLPEPKRLEAMSNLVLDELSPRPPETDQRSQPTGTTRKRGIVFDSGPVAKKHFRKKRSA